MHSLRRHSNSNWKRQFSINRFERSQNFTSFVGTFKSQLKKPDHYWNDYKDDITLHSLWGHSITNWKRQFSIEMISNMKEPYIFCADIQIPTEIDSSVLKWLQRWQNLTFFVGTFQFQLKNHFSVVMISIIKELYILCCYIQIPTEKQRLLLKWLQRWQTLTFFVGTFKF